MGLGSEEEAALELASQTARTYRRTDHLRRIGSQLDHEAAARAFMDPTPQQGMPADHVIAELAERSEAGLQTTTSPRFHGWVTGASHPVGVAADWLASAWGQVASYSEISPAAVAAEQAAASWLLDILGLPAGAGLGLATGATMANFAALAAARTALLDRAGWDVEADGLFGAPEVNVVLGGEAHSSVYLTLRMLGFGARRVHVAASDGQGRMCPEALAECLDKLTGPTLVCLQAGNVNSGAFDPFAELVPLAHAHGAWAHIDGAFGLWAAAAPATQPLTAGMADADSWAADAHKWLQAPYDCGVVIVREPDALARAMGSTASYLPQSGRRNPADFAPELSRRARGFPIWAILKTLGREGVAEMVERHCAIARQIADRLTREPGLSVLNDVVLNQVVLACGEASDPGSDRLTEATLAAVQAEGRCYPSAGRWHNRSIIRISVCSGPATPEDGAETAEAIISAWRRVSAVS